VSIPFAAPAVAVWLELLLEGLTELTCVRQIPHARLEFECEGLEGMSLRDVVEHDSGLNASMLGEYLECACSGVMACSTCHVIVQPDWFDKVGAPDASEQVHC
jgi:ferredoxin